MTISWIVYSLLLVPGINGGEPVLDVAWSLVHTVYFYLIFSVLIFFKTNISKWIIAGWSAVTLAFVMQVIYSDQYITYFLFNEYNLIFLAGAGYAYAVIRYPCNVKLGVVLVLTGLIGFPLTWLNYLHEIVNFDFDYSRRISSVLIIYSLASIDMQRKINSPKLLNYLGNASFAIYLSHNLVLNALSELFSWFHIYDNLGGVMTSMVLTLLLICAGCAVHSLIEVPVVEQLKRLLFKKKSLPEKDTGLEIQREIGG